MDRHALLGNEDGMVHLPHPAESSHVTRPSYSVHRVRAILNKTADLLETPVH